MGVIGSFSELTKDFSPERRERIEQRKEAAAGNAPGQKLQR